MRKFFLIFTLLISTVLFAGPNDDLLEAARQGDVEKIKTALNAGADVNYEMPGPGITAIFLAAQGGHVEAVKLLIKMKADVNGMEKMDGRTVLIISSQNGHPEVVELLIRAGAKINMKDYNNHTALGMAEFIATDADGELAARIQKVITILKKAGAK